MSHQIPAHNHGHGHGQNHLLSRSASASKSVSPTRHSKISRLVGRLRSGSHDASAQAPHEDCPSAAKQPKRQRAHTSALRPGPFRSAKPHPAAGLKTAATPSICNDAQVSVDLWTSAYDYLRDQPGSAGLVMAYESIIAQELPNHLKTGGLNTTFRDFPESQRFELCKAIATAGIAKRRPFDPRSQSDDSARRIVDNAKDTVDLILITYSAAAIAFCGFCTLTPTLLDPMLKQSEMRDGITHVAGRISWYMFLSQFTLYDSWCRPSEDFALNKERIRDEISRLYRKILEFEMNCICGAASEWNKLAKNVVDWQGIGGLVEAIHEAEAKVRDSVDRFATEPIQRWLENCDRDMGLPGVEKGDMEAAEQ